VLRPSANDKIGDKIEVMLPKKRSSSTLFGEIIRNFGASSKREANYEAILSECEIPVEFSDEAISVANEAASEPIEDKGRRRLDREIIFTIDGAGAKDLDDAISLSKLANGKWLLGVHIADVSHYVREKTALDRDAMKRGTSVYFVDKVVPMLPAVLSNGACSLNAGEDKYALSAHITLSSLGVIEKCRIEKTIIRSRVRGVYSEVNSLFAEGKNSPYYSKYREVYPTLTKMRSLYELLEKKNKEKGALELESAEAQIILDENGEPIDIKKSERGDAERLIEAFMICANEAVATLLNEKEIPCVYRVHEAPPKDKLDSFISYSSNLGLDVRALRTKEPSARELSSILEQAREKGIENAVSITLLRTMAKAKYSDNNSLHYGLGLELYCHFTSPIRRLSDLATHRIISEVLLGGAEARKYRSYAKRAAIAASEAELRALSAERQIEALYKTIYMSRFIGKTFDAVVSSVTKFGLFAELDNTCEGLVPIGSLDGYYYYDEGRKTLSNGKCVYSLGDRLKIKVENTDISARTVEFSLAE
ncbi:MAG: VacB/RNase II family 3'-5' exoribonuclease, partial [Clostridia bacterium]|nr:VacB/RNase II family 3'-5' exoribonuclease [Clostridia bacterium]